MADRADSVTGRSRFAAGLGLLALLEILWFGWYLIEPLPSAEGARTTLPGGEVKVEPVRRWFLLAEAIPYFVPGTEWGDSLLGGTINAFLKVRYLPQRVPIAAAGLFVASGAMGLGFLILRALRLSAALSMTERIGLAFGLGLNGLSTLMLGLGKFGFLNPWPIRGGLAALAIGGIGLEVAKRRKGVGERSKVRLRPLVGFALVAGPFLILMMLASMQPCLEFDSVEYHLEGPKEWYQAGRIMFLAHNVYTTMPFSVEMLHLLGMVVVGDWWEGALVGQFLVMLHEPATALLIAMAAARWGSPRAGWVAAIVYLGTPWAYRLSVFPFVEGPLNYYHAALIWVMARAWSVEVSEEKSALNPVALWFVAGWLAGGAMACKYPGLISAVIPAGMVATCDVVRKRDARIWVAMGVGVFVAVGPWLIKNAVEHGNPVYPLENALVGGHPWSAEREAKWNRAHGPKPITWGYFVAGVLDVAGRNDCQSALYTALVPLAFFRRTSRRFALVLFGYAVYIFATWWVLTHRLDRFYLPILAPLAILAGVGSDWSRKTAWTVMLSVVMTVGLFTGFVFDISALAGLNRWTDDLEQLRVDVPRMASPTLAWLDDNLPKGSKVLLVGQAGVFHLRMEKLYNTVFDEEILENLAKDRHPDEVEWELRRRGVTHILVDWDEVERHRKPGGYGFTPFISHRLFSDLVRMGVLEPEPGPGPTKELYRVRRDE